MIEEGDKVVLQSGDKSTVEKIDKVVYNELITVYNFEVEDFHTYFVSDASVLVHNTATCESNKKNSKPNQIHHFATNKSSKYTKYFNNIASKYRLNLDGDWNKASLPHQGRHPYAYHEFVLNKMREFDRVAKGDQKKFLKLFNQLKKQISDNPDMLYKAYWNKK